MGYVFSFEKLEVWKEAIKLSVGIYKITKLFPDEEKFGLVSQMRRCSVSISSNIAEGTAKSTDRHFIQFLENSLGSAFEWETQLIIAFEIGYISKETFEHLERKIQSIQGMITRFIENLKQNNS